ncbi:MlaA family lipoprotein [Azospirillum sp. sgz301742]
MLRSAFAVVRTLSTAAVLLALAGCASSPPQPASGDVANDPLEIPNRFVFAANDAVDTLLIRPAAEVYHGVVPDPVRDVVRNILRNLLSPLTIANDLLQGDFAAAQDDTGRFMINTIIGLGGAADVAETAGLPYRERDFGQTLGRWGVGEGAYLVLPLYGPSTLRDAAGLGVDSLADPVGYVARAHDLTGWLFVREGVSGLDKRANALRELDDVRRNSIDYYATLRSLYLQQRRTFIGGAAGAQPGVPEFPEFPDDTPAKTR